MSPHDKALRWLHGAVRTPPLSSEARIEAGYLRRRLQRGESLGLPYSWPLPIIGPRCHELRIVDRDNTWRIPYRIDVDAIVILDVFPKKTQALSDGIRKTCQQRLKDYDDE